MENDSLIMGIVDVTAKEDLKRGAYVRLESDSEHEAPQAVAATKFSHSIGIVNPFQLKKDVAAGEAFYLLLNPEVISISEHVSWNFNSKSGVGKEDSGDSCCPETYWYLDDAKISTELPPTAKPQ